MSFGTDHDHRGEYADIRHVHDGDYAEQRHHHRDYAADGHDHDTSHNHPELTSHDHPELASREAVAAMLDAFRLDMRDRITANSAALAAAIGATSRTNDAALSALEGRASALEALRDRVELLEGRADALYAQLTRLEGALERLEAALEVLDEDEDQAPELGHAAALAAAPDKDADELPDHNGPGWGVQ